MKNKRRIILIIAVAAAWLLLALLGYLIAQVGEWWFGTRCMMIAASIVALIAVVMLFGQYLAGTADYFLSINNPRPLDDHQVPITSHAWGFASETSRTAKAELAGEGFADIRLSATRIHMVISLFTFGFARPVSIVWRGNAGQHPLGEA